MKNKPESTRRGFIKKLAASAAAVAAGTNVFADPAVENTAYLPMRRRQFRSPNDNINIALIGAGKMGRSDVGIALKIPGVRLIAVCDVYEDNLTRAKQRWGSDLYTTRIYREILNRTDVDAVIIATPDHWHQQISIDALHSGKHVYCEKPMVHSITEGPAVIRAQKKSGKIFQVGSQGLSSLGNEKAKELLRDGAIGQLNYAEGFWARYSPRGAWQYPIPESASPENVDWEAFLGKAENRAFDPTRFFRWRNYRDYGTGVSGDLFVHLFSSLHFITDSLGPEKIYASGGLRYWKDGREFPDVLLGIFDYPEVHAHPAFNLSLRCNFVDGTSGSTSLKLVGSEGSMDVTSNSVILKRNKNPSSDNSFQSGQRKDTAKSIPGRSQILSADGFTFEAEKDYPGGPHDHFVNFFNAIRHNEKVVEDAIFGYRATAPALLCNDSYTKGAAMFWDPEKMQIMKKRA